MRWAQAHDMRFTEADAIVAVAHENIPSVDDLLIGTLTLCGTAQNMNGSRSLPGAG
jgi:hypothetical protein